MTILDLLREWLRGWRGYDVDTRLEVLRLLLKK